MKFVRIKTGKHKGRVGKVIKEFGEEGEALVEVKGEEKPVRVRIDWLEALKFVSRLINFILSIMENKKK